MLEGGNIARLGSKDVFEENFCGIGRTREVWGVVIKDFADGTLLGVAVEGLEALGFGSIKPGVRSAMRRSSTRRTVGNTRTRTASGGGVECRGQRLSFSCEGGTVCSEDVPCAVSFQDARPFFVECLKEVGVVSG